MASTLGRDLQVWRRGHLVPLAFSTQLEFLKGNVQVTYVTMVPRGNETLRRRAILPASLLELCFIPGSWSRLHLTCFWAFWSWRHPHLMSRHQFGLITHMIQSLISLKGVPLAFSTQRLVPSGNHGYIRNLDVFLQTHSFCLLKILTDGLEWCGLLWCFYQLFGLSFWRHPFTAEHPLLRQ